MAVTPATPVVFCAVMLPFPGATDDSQPAAVHDQCFQVGATFPTFSALTTWLTGPAGTGVFQLWQMLGGGTAHSQLSLNLGPKPKFLP